MCVPEHGMAFMSCIIIILYVSSCGILSRFGALNIVFCSSSLFMYRILTGFSSFIIWFAFSSMSFSCVWFGGFPRYSMYAFGPWFADIVVTGVSNVFIIA